MNPIEQGTAPQSELPRGLSTETAEFDRLRAGRSRLGSFVAHVTEFLHGEQQSLNSLTLLSGRAELLERAGAEQAARELRDQVDRSLREARRASAAAEEVTAYGTNFLKSVGLFYPGAAGRSASMVLFALDQTRASDSTLLQAADLATGAVKGLAMKATMDRVANMKTNIAAKAFLTGGAFRLSEVGLSRQTWFSKEDGTFQPLSAIGRTALGAVEPTALLSDALVFGTAHLAMHKLKMSHPQLLNNRVVATGLSGTFFGFSSGLYSELRRSQEQGDPFQYRRMLIQAGLDGLAAVPGGVRLQMQRSAARPVHDVAESSPRTAEGKQAVAGIEPARLLPAASRQGTTLAREFIVVGDGRALQRFIKGDNSAALLSVREIGDGGRSVGDPRSLLVQHLDIGRRVMLPAAAPDMVASCNPAMLEGLRSRHVLPGSSGPVWMTAEAGGQRLRFSTEPSAVRPGAAQIALNRPVAELLLEVPKGRRYWDLHDLNAYAEVLKHFRTPGKKIAGGGADSMAIELVDGTILKITAKPFRSQWGTRTYIDMEGRPRRFDARLICDPVECYSRSSERPVTWYLQEKARMIVSTRQLSSFADRIERNTDYVFWDMDLSAHGRSQAGIVDRPSGRRIVLIDYDAVRKQQDVPESSREPHSLSRSPWDPL